MKTNLSSSSVFERSERTTGDCKRRSSLEHRRRLILLVKNWIFAAGNFSREQEDDMPRMSCDESTEPFSGRRLSPGSAKVVG